MSPSGQSPPTLVYIYGPPIGSSTIAGSANHCWALVNNRHAVIDAPDLQLRFEAVLEVRATTPPRRLHTD